MLQFRSAASLFLALPKEIKVRDYSDSSSMCGGGLSEEQKELKKRNEDIEKNIKKDKAIAEKEIKMLLLGINHASI